MKKGVSRFSATSRFVSRRGRAALPLAAALVIACGGTSEGADSSRAVVRPSLEELAGWEIPGLDRVFGQVSTDSMRALHYAPAAPDGSALAVTVEVRTCQSRGCDQPSDPAAALARATRDLTIAAANDPFIKMEAGQVALSDQHHGSFVTVRSHVDVKLIDGRTLVSTYNCYEATYNDGSWTIQVAVCPRGGPQIGSRSELPDRLPAATGEAVARQSFAAYASAFAGNGE